MKLMLGWLQSVFLIGICYAWQPDNNYQSCRCVPYYQCPVNTYHRSTGASIYGIGTGTTQQNVPPQGVCDDLHSVCCPINIMRETDTATIAFNDQPNPELVSFSFVGPQDSFHRLLGQSPSPSPDSSLPSLPSSSSGSSLPSLPSSALGSSIPSVPTVSPFSSPRLSPVPLPVSSPVSSPGPLRKTLGARVKTNPVVSTTVRPTPVWPDGYFWASVPSGNGNLYIGTLEQQIFIFNTIKDVVETTTAKPNKTGPGTTGPSTNSTTANKTDDCKCVPLYQCSKDNTIKTDGFNIVQPRSHNFEKLSEIPKQKGKKCGPQEVCCKKPYPKPINGTKSFKEQRQCGKAILYGVANETAEYAEFPWTVAIMLLESRATLRCGGSLIHPQIVLTSASCVSEIRNVSSKIMVRAGDLDLKEVNELLPHQERGVRDIIIPESYAPLISDDYALLILNEPVDFSYENVGSVCLPESDNDFDFYNCILTGWGDRNAPSNKIGVLRKILVKELPLTECEKALETQLYGNQLDKSYICANSLLGIYVGDSGGPLLCPSKNDRDKYVQAGIASVSNGDGFSTEPMVFYNVALAKAWIDLTAAINGFNINEYQENS